MPPKINGDACTGCGRCTEVCPLDVFRMVDGSPQVLYGDECWHCGCCAMECTTGAIRIELPLQMRPVARRIK